MYLKIEYHYSADFPVLLEAKKDSKFIVKQLFFNVFVRFIE